MADISSLSDEELNAIISNGKRSLKFKSPEVAKEYAMNNPDFKAIIDKGPGGRGTSGYRTKNPSLKRFLATGDLKK